MDEECHNFLMLSVNSYELNVLVAAVTVAYINFLTVQKSTMHMRISYTSFNSIACTGP